MTKYKYRIGRTDGGHVEVLCQTVEFTDGVAFFKNGNDIVGAIPLANLQYALRQNPEGEPLQSKSPQGL